jgi:hypothetical protein
MRHRPRHARLRPAQPAAGSLLPLGRVASSPGRRDRVEAAAGPVSRGRVLLVVVDPSGLHQPVERRIGSPRPVASGLADPQPPGGIVRGRAHDDVQDVHDHQRHPDAVYRESSYLRPVRLPRTRGGLAHGGCAIDTGLAGTPDLTRRRPAPAPSVTLSRTATLAITAPALPQPPRPRKPAGQRADAGRCTLTSVANVKPRHNGLRGPCPQLVRRRGPVRGCPWKTSGHPDRPYGTNPARHTSVDTATSRPTALRGDTRRDRERRPASHENSQLAGHNRRWWQVLGSNQRRLSQEVFTFERGLFSRLV